MTNQTHERLFCFTLKIQVIKYIFSTNQVFIIKRFSQHSQKKKKKLNEVIKFGTKGEYDSYHFLLSFILCVGEVGEKELSSQYSQQSKSEK